MDHVPLLFAESVAWLFDFNSLFSLLASRSRLFRKVCSLIRKKQLEIALHVVYNPAADTFDYCVTCGMYESDRSPTPYPYDPADHRFVYFFKLILLEDKSSLEDVEETWTTATPSDPTFLKLLRTPFFRTELRLNVKCPELLKILPDYYTFNYIYNCGPFDHSEVLDAIIQRSQACGRLESLYYREFFKKRGREASIDWISTNKRLRRIVGYSIENTESVRSTLYLIGVQ